MKRVRHLLAQERKSTVIPTESEIAAEEAAMAEGLKRDQAKDLQSYHERERHERQERIDERQKEYDKRLI
jgi:hypothetical protein